VTKTPGRKIQQDKQPVGRLDEIHSKLQGLQSVNGATRDPANHNRSVCFVLDFFLGGR
jgi:hypothetical protein